MRFNRESFSACARHSSGLLVGVADDAARPRAPDALDSSIHASNSNRTAARHRCFEFSSDAPTSSDTNFRCSVIRGESRSRCSNLDYCWCLRISWCTGHERGCNTRHRSRTVVARGWSVESSLPQHAIARPRMPTIRADVVVHGLLLRVHGASPQCDFLHHPNESACTASLRSLHLFPRVSLIASVIVRPGIPAFRRRRAESEPHKMR